jgi:hypothetical protein
MRSYWRENTRHHLGEARIMMWVMRPNKVLESFLEKHVLPGMKHWAAIIWRKAAEFEIMSHIQQTKGVGEGPGGGFIKPC